MFGYVSFLRGFASCFVLSCCDVRFGFISFLSPLVPDRIKLFRAQASRSVGGNGRRTSHNPPDPIMLDIYDRLGVMVMDENRVLYNDTEHEREMRYAIMIILIV